MLSTRAAPTSSCSSASPCTPLGRMRAWSGRSSRSSSQPAAERNCPRRLLRTVGSASALKLLDAVCEFLYGLDKGGHQRRVVDELEPALPSRTASGNTRSTSCAITPATRGRESRIDSSRHSNVTPRSARTRASDDPHGRSSCAAAIYPQRSYDMANLPTVPARVGCSTGGTATGERSHRQGARGSAAESANGLESPNRLTGGLVLCEADPRSAVPRTQGEGNGGRDQAKNGHQSARRCRCRHARSGCPAGPRRQRRGRTQHYRRHWRTS